MLGLFALRRLNVIGGAVRHWDRDGAARSESESWGVRPQNEWRMVGGGVRKKAPWQEIRPQA